MTSTNRKARSLDAQETASQDKTPAQLRVVTEQAERRRPTHQETTETASEGKLDSRIEAANKSADRWHALEELLSNSVDLISPAYLFMCFPPSRYRQIAVAARPAGSAPQFKTCWLTKHG